MAGVGIRQCRMLVGQLDLDLDVSHSFLSALHTLLSIFTVIHYGHVRSLSLERVWVV